MSSPDDSPDSRVLSRLSSLHVLHVLPGQRSGHQSSSDISVASSITPHNAIQALNHRDSRLSCCGAAVCYTPGRSRTNRWTIAQLCIASTTILAALFVLLLHQVPQFRPSNTEHEPGDPCQPSYPTVFPSTLLYSQTQPDVSERLSIAIVTMHDTRLSPMPPHLAELTGIPEGFNVDILEAVWKNRQAYADRHGYKLVDGTQERGTDRPPAWYKIKAVQSVLGDYDWVYWLDPDAWFTNLSTPLETLLPAHASSGNEGADLVVSQDVTGFNSGSWIVRNSPWSHAFLQEWWDLEELIRPREDTKSGDNDAMKHLLLHMDEAELKAHVAEPPQCSMNSYLWRFSWRQVFRMLYNRSSLTEGIWHPGHLLVHFAGWDPNSALNRLQQLLLTDRTAVGVKRRVMQRFVANSV